jgi:ATP-dependent RNA helicase DeaD
LEYLVLDEADEMLDMGFLEDIERVFEAANPERRVLLFSATMPSDILRVARKQLGDYETIEDESSAVETALTEQIWLEVHETDKVEALQRIIDVEEEFYGIVFCATKIDTDELAKRLQTSGYGAEALHGDLSQSERERVLGRFRNKTTRILTATDVAARGIDVERLTHVVNFSLPHDPDSYTHRIGRTGRAGNTGTAITFVTPEEYRRLFSLRKGSGKSLKKGEIPQVDEVISAKRDRIKARVLAELERYNQGTQLDTKREAEEWDAAEIPKPDNKAFAPWLELADDLLSSVGAREAVASALASGFEGELDPSRYREMRQASVDERARARLFIGAGRKHRYGKREVADLVKRLSGLPDRLVGVEIFETCSFVMVPFGDAERIIEAARKSGGLPPVRAATPRKDDERERPFKSRSDRVPGRKGGFKKSPRKKK